MLGAGPGQIGLLEAARARDLYVVAADRDPAAPGFPLADRRALISVEDERALERLADAEQVDGVIAPGIDWPVAIAARICAKLGLPHPLSVETAQLATSKLRQRELFAVHASAQKDLERFQTLVAKAAETQQNLDRQVAVVGQVKATIDGVVRDPSLFGITTASPPSSTATQLLVVPRSMPMTLLIS